MTRTLAAVALAAAALVPAAAHAAPGPIFEPGGQCNGVVDVGCRSHVCQPDELDCGMIPPCLVWVVATGCLL